MKLCAQRRHSSQTSCPQAFFLLARCSTDARQGSINIGKSEYHG